MLWATTGLPNGSRVMSGDFREYSDCGWVTMPSTCAYQFLQILEPLKPGGTYPAMFNPETADEVLLLAPDRKSTRLNSSHQIISYAVFCLKKKKQNIIDYNSCLS